MSNWYQLAAAQVVEHFQTDLANGLTQNEVSHRLQLGVNELVERGLKRPWQIIWEQLTASTMLILLVAAIISAWWKQLTVPKLSARDALNHVRLVR